MWAGAAIIRQIGTIFCVLFSLQAFAGWGSHEVNYNDWQVRMGQSPHPVVFGVEPTFSHTRGYFLSEEEIDRKLERLQKFFEERYSRLSVAQQFSLISIADRGAYQFQLKFRSVAIGQDFTISVTRDPGVLEVKMDPGTVEYYEFILPLLRQGIWSVMKLFDLVPHLHKGMGHVHIDRESFQDDRHLQSFYADFSNHSELPMGIWEKDYDNARPAILATGKFLAGFVETLNGDQLGADHIRIVERRFVNHTRPSDKNVGVGPALMWRQQTLELRGNHAFASPQSMILLLKILRNRIEHTSKIERILFVPHAEKSPEQKIIDYSNYAIDVDFEEARQLILPSPRDGSENLYALSFKVFPPDGRIRRDLLEVPSLCESLLIPPQTGN